jgi:hypothetical protein
MGKVASYLGYAALLWFAAAGELRDWLDLTTYCAGAAIAAVVRFCDRDVLR